MCAFNAVAEETLVAVADEHGSKNRHCHSSSLHVIRPIFRVSFDVWVDILTSHR